MKWSPAFRMLWLAETTSALGNGMRWVALPLLAVRQSTDPWTISLITAAQQLPWLLVGLVAGALADRYDRRRLAAWCDAARAALMAAFTAAVALNWTPIPVIVSLGFLLTCGEALAGAAISALIPAVVPPQARPTANGHLQAGAQVTDSLIGTPAGAALFGFLAVAPFALDAATFAASAICIMLLRLPTPNRTPAGPPPRPTAAEATRDRPTADDRAPAGRLPLAAAAEATLGEPATDRRGTAGPSPVPTAAGHGGAAWPGDAGAAPGRRGLRHEVAEGVRFLWDSPMLRALCLLSAVENAAFTGVVAVLVLFATTTLGLSPAAFGLLVAVFAVGGVAGGLSAGRLAARLGLRACLLGSTVVGAVAVAGFAVARTALEADAVALVLGVAWTVAAALTASLRQHAVPDALMGRVTSAFRLVSAAAGPAGALAAGAMAHAYGLRSPFPAAGALLIAGAVALAPSLRGLRTDHPAAAPHHSTAPPPAAPPR